MQKCKRESQQFNFGAVRTIIELAEGIRAIISTGELLAAGMALSRGDSAPLLRLGAEGIVPLVTDKGDPAFFSAGLTH